MIDYLLKPISLDRFMIAAQKARNRLETDPVEPLPPAGPGSVPPAPEYIFVKSDYRTLKVALRDIHYLEGMGDYVAIHLKGKKILTLENMKHFEKILPEQEFVRIHKSYLVAIGKIEFIERNRIVINEQRLPIGATYKDTFWNRIAG